MIEEKVKPKIELKELENTVVNVKTLDEMNNLMKILELSENLKWVGGYSPINGAFAEKRIKCYNENTCINLNGGKFLTFGPKKIYQNVSSFQNFCENNKITSEKLNDINNYFN